MKDHNSHLGNHLDIYAGEAPSLPKPPVCVSPRISKFQVELEAAIERRRATGER